MRSARRPCGFCPECGAWRDSLHRDHILPRWKGGDDSPENIQWICANCHEDKTRLDLMGRRNSAEAIASMRAKNTGQKRTAEAREKMSEAALGRELTPDTRAKISAALTGKRRKPFSDEHRAKMSLAQLRRWAAVSEPPAQLK